jgi:hypothetical protein
MEQKTCNKCRFSFPATRLYFTWREPVGGKQGAFGHCLECCRKAARDYRLRNLEKVREKDRERYQLHREQKIARVKLYNTQNREHVRAYKAAWHGRNRGRRPDVVDLSRAPDDQPSG